MADASSGKLPVVLLLGPHRGAVSGVSTHLNLLFSAGLGQKVQLNYFQVGSEGRKENVLSRLLRLLASPVMLAAALLVTRTEIVHLNTSLNPLAYWRDLSYMVVARLCGSRVIYQVHGGKLPQQFAGDNPLLRTLLRASLSLAEVIVVLAQCEFDAYRDFMPGANLRVIPNAIDCAPYRALQRVPGAPQGALRLIYIGRLSRQKGLDEALAGLSLARAEGIEANLVIAGSGPDEAFLRGRVEALGLGPAVRFAGAVFGAEKMALLAEADVLLFPTYAEGLPYALLECMAAGIPAITTRVGAIPDVLISGLHGIFVPPRTVHPIAQAIGELARNRTLLAQMSAACRVRVATRYSLQRFAGDFSRVYLDADVSRRSGGVRGLWNRSS